MASSPAPVRLKPPTEKVEQALIIRLFRLAGIRVRSTSQYRASHVAAGIPDLMLHGAGWSGWFEVKAYQAKGYDRNNSLTWKTKELRPEQMAFMADASRAGQVVGSGASLDAQRLLVIQGLAKWVTPGVIQIIRQDGAA